MRIAAQYIDAVNLDLKGFDKEYLWNVCRQRLDDILRALKVLKKEGVWIELTNLIVPTLNDSEKYIKEMTNWIVGELGPDTPLHFSRFWPQYKLRSLYPTPEETLIKAREIAIDSGLNYVYLGNVPGLGSENTICPGCGQVVIMRKGYKILKNKLLAGKCASCGKTIAGIWE
jgi:pyruvate formate lyase activating enzyme